MIHHLKVSAALIPLISLCSLLHAKPSPSESSESACVRSAGGRAFLPTPSTVLGPEDVTGGSLAGFQPPVLYQDNGTYGPEVEVVHYYYDQWPIGLATYPTGDNKALYACYTRGSEAYTLGKITNLTAEEPWPNQQLNSPPGGLQDKDLSMLTGYTMASNMTDHFISVQALYTDPKGRLWVLDTGRPTINTAGGASTSAYAVVGGPKLVLMNRENATIERAYTFPGDVHYPDSSMNDVRFDLRPNLTSSGQGVAYIVDSSNEGRNAFIILDLGSGKSWRRLEQHPSLLHTYNNRASYNGAPKYITIKGQSELSNKEGFDGLALSQNGEYAYYSPLVSQNLYRVPTSVLLEDNGPNGTDGHEAELKASNAVQDLGQKGSQTNGFDSDTNGRIYLLAPEQNAIFAYNPNNSRVETFVRDPRFYWIDSAVVADDGYLYGNINQLPKQMQWNNGDEMRIKPGFMFRVKLPDGGTRITSALGG